MPRESEYRGWEWHYMMAEKTLEKALFADMDHGAQLLAMIAQTHATLATIRRDAPVPVPELRLSQEQIEAIAKSLVEEGSEWWEDGCVRAAVQEMLDAQIDPDAYSISRIQARCTYLAPEYAQPEFQPEDKAAGALEPGDVIDVRAVLQAVIDAYPQHANGAPWADYQGADQYKAVLDKTPVEYSDSDVFLKLWPDGDGIPVPAELQVRVEGWQDAEEIIEKGDQS